MKNTSQEINALASKYMGALVGKISQSTGTLVLIRLFFLEREVLSIMFYMSYWFLEREGTIILSSDDDGDDVEFFKHNLDNLLGRKLENIEFDGEDFNISFSGGYTFGVTDDPDGYCKDDVLIDFLEVGENQSLLFSTEKGFYRVSVDEEI